MKRLLLFILLVSVSIVPAVAQDMEELPWWNDTVWYEIFVRSFYDSDGDGIGDFQGLIQQLDYLNDGDPNTTDDLGITGIWLMPIMDSVSYHGYDVRDYMTVHPDFGTNEDFKEFMDAAHERGIRVIIDLVVNHSASEHEWFRASAIGDEEFTDWYVWSDTDPGTPGPWGANAWHSQGSRYYYGVFCCGMPDLNYDNPDVTDAMYDIARFWIEDMGVDGFRLDAIKYVIEQDGLLQNTPANRQWLADFTDYVKSLNPDAITVGEVDDTTSAILPYIEDGAVDIAFEFDLAEEIIASVGARNNRNISRFLDRRLDEYPVGQYAPFLTNHDQARIATKLNGNVEQNKIAATILLTLPGSPFLYYGEEIGIWGEKPDPRLRTPMQWTSDPDTAGFTTGTPYEALQDDVATANVETQLSDEESLLAHYRTFIALRDEYDVLRNGDVQVVSSSPNRILSYIRQNEDTTWMILINMNRDDMEGYTLELEEGALTGMSNATLIYGEGDIAMPEINDAGGFDEYVPMPMIPAFGIYIIELS